MAWCLTAPSYYLNQRWLIISKVWWHSTEGKRCSSCSMYLCRLDMTLKMTIWRIQPHLKWTNELKGCLIWFKFIQVYTKVNLGKETIYWSRFVWSQKVYLFILPWKCMDTRHRTNMIKTIDQISRASRASLRAGICDNLLRELSQNSHTFSSHII